MIETPPFQGKLRVYQEGYRDEKHHQIGGNVEHCCSNHVIIIRCALRFVAVSKYMDITRPAKLTVDDWDRPVLLNGLTPHSKIENLSNNKSQHTVTCKNFYRKVLLQPEPAKH